MFEGTEIQDGVAEFKKKLDGPIKVLRLEIRTEEMTLEAQDPKNAEHIDAYKYSKGSVSGPTPVNLTRLIVKPLEDNLFKLDDVNLDAIPGLMKASVEQASVEEGKVTQMELSRGLILSPPISMGPPQWNILVEGPRGNATVYANAKGEIVKVQKR
jgi:SpoVK/Ycf46/Vps4 family AAA+-type ATPase